MKKYNKLLWYIWNVTNIFITNCFLGIKKKEVLFCDQGSLPLTCRCCSTRLLRCMSMCLALSQVSLHRDVCPRLSDSNLSNRDTVSATQTCLCTISRGLGKSWEVVKNRKGVPSTRACMYGGAFSVSLRIALDFITNHVTLSCNKTWKQSCR